MICFKDVTFCTYHESCLRGLACRVALTDKVKAEAEKWWGNPDAPICVYTDKPQCFKEITNDSKS